MTREQRTLLSRFRAGNMYLGSIHLPRDSVSDAFCLICGYELNRMHVIEEYRGLNVEMSRPEEAVPLEFRWALSLLEHKARGPFSELLFTVRDRCMRRYSRK